MASSLDLTFSRMELSNPRFTSAVFSLSDFLLRLDITGGVEYSNGGSAMRGISSSFEVEADGVVPAGGGSGGGGILLVTSFTGASTVSKGLEPVAAARNSCRSRWICKWCWAISSSKGDIRFEGTPWAVGLPLPVWAEALPVASIGLELSRLECETDQ